MAVFVDAVGVDEHADERGSRGEAQSRKWAMYRVTKQRVSKVVLTSN